MEKLYKKNELTFALVWIAIYVVAFSVADSVSESLGMMKCVTLPVSVVLSGLLCLVMKRLGTLKVNGLCMWEGNAKRYLYFVPLLVLCATQFLSGAQMSRSPVESVLYAATMLFVGFMEEVIFRGLLFNAVLKKNGKLIVAILIAGISFGLGHIVNLLNGREVLDTLRQLVYASAIGIMLTVLFYVSKSLWPCIVFHSVFNALSTFAVEGSVTTEWIFTAVVVVIGFGYAYWLWKKHQSAPNKTANA